MKSALAVLRDRAGKIACAIAQRAPAGSILVIFAGGSLARGHVWAAEVDGELEIYSDIDLYVVARDGERAAAVRDASREVVDSQSNDVPGVRFVRGVDAGVYTPEDLRAQPLRPGTADLSERHVVLYGDEGAVVGLLPAASGSIDPSEALYLLENRAWDALDGERQTGVGERLRRVTSLKLDLDVAVAHMIASRAPLAAVSDAASALHAGESVVTDPVVLDAAWRAALARDDLAESLNRPSPAESAAARVSRAWLALAPGVLGLDSDDAAALVAHRCEEGRRVKNGREFVRVARRAGMSRWRALAGATGCSARSPRTTLRVHALVRSLEAQSPAGAFDAQVAFASRVALALGFNDGPDDHRIRDAHRALST